MSGSDIVVVVPVLARPRRARLLSDSLWKSGSKAKLLFVATAGDTAEIRACKATGYETLIAPWEAGRADWARKINLAYRSTTQALLLLGADDLEFEPGWDEAVLRVFGRHDVGVVGTNDGANPKVKRGEHSTHPVVCRGYAKLHGTADADDLVCHEGYWHEWVDNELVETAMSRGCWAFAKDAAVTHRHPAWGTAEVDDTYRRGQLQAAGDRELFKKRRPLWATR